MKEVVKKQYTWEYFQAHCGVAGASNASSIATPAKGDYPASAKTLICQLLADKLDPQYGMYEDTSTAAMKNGLVREPEARRFAEFELDCEIRQAGLLLTDDGRFCCSPDGLIGDDGGIELKVPNAATHVKYLLAGKLPDDYRPQVHWSLIVTERKFWYFMSWSPFMVPLVVRVEPDEYTEKLRANMERFWKEYQEAKVKFEKLIPQPPSIESPVVVDIPAFGQVELPSYESHY